MNIFLCHAHIYVFAKKYNIASLRTLALYKSHKTPKNFKVYGKLIEDIVTLVQYDNTHDHELGMR
jgi:hypothetical protein